MIYKWQIRVVWKVIKISKIEHCSTLKHFLICEYNELYYLKTVYEIMQVHTNKKMNSEKVIE